MLVSVSGYSLPSTLLHSASSYRCVSACSYLPWSRSTIARLFMLETLIGTLLQFQLIGPSLFMLSPQRLRTSHADGTRRGDQFCFRCFLGAAQVYPYDLNLRYHFA